MPADSTHARVEWPNSGLHPGSFADEFLPTPAAAGMLHVAPRTLERMRSEGSGPPFIKAGRRCLYRRSSLVAWAEARSFSSTAEAKRAAPR